MPRPDRGRCRKEKRAPKRPFSYPEDDVPAGQEAFVALNAELAKDWPVITERKDALPDAKAWEGKPDKLELLQR